MDDFYKKIADILEVDEVKSSDVLDEFATWDSLAILSVIAMLDSKHGITLNAAQINQAKTVGDLALLVNALKKI